MHLLAASPRRCLLFCDDLSFDAGETSYKSLKAVLEGGIEGRPPNVLFYATSNRRHLMPRQMIENERATAVIPGEAIEEKVSLSDRFGLWLGFHPCNQETYLAMVERYADRFGLEVDGGDAEARGPGVVQDPRQPLGPGGVAVHPGPGGAAGEAGRHGRAGGVGHRPQGAVRDSLVRAGIPGRLRVSDGPQHEQAEVGGAPQPPLRHSRQCWYREVLVRADERQVGSITP